MLTLHSPWKVPSDDPPCTQTERHNAPGKGHSSHFAPSLARPLDVLIADPRTVANEVRQHDYLAGVQRTTRHNGNPCRAVLQGVNNREAGRVQQRRRRAPSQLVHLRQAFLPDEDRDVAACGPCDGARGCGEYLLLVLNVIKARHYHTTTRVLVLRYFEAAASLRSRTTTLSTALRAQPQH
jgi:hypothetical protein